MYLVTSQQLKILSSHVSSDNSPIPHAGGQSEETGSCDVWPSFEQTHATTSPPLYYAEVRNFEVSLLSFTKLTRLQTRSSSLRGSGGGTNRRDTQRVSERLRGGGGRSVCLSVCLYACRSCTTTRTNVTRGHGWKLSSEARHPGLVFRYVETWSARCKQRSPATVVARFKSSTLTLCMLTPTLLTSWLYRINASSTTL